MELDLLAAFLGLVIMGIGAWFYAGSGWKNRRCDRLLQYMFKAAPIGLSFVVLALAHAGVFGPITGAMAVVGLALMVLSWILACLQPRWLAPKWLRLRPRP